MRKPKSFIGLATVGTKGQIVIPSEARQEFRIVEGDKLLILRGCTKKTPIIVTVPEIGKVIAKSGLDYDGYQRHPLTTRQLVDAQMHSMPYCSNGRPLRTYREDGESFRQTLRFV